MEEAIKKPEGPSPSQKRWSNFKAKILLRVRRDIYAYVAALYFGVWQHNVLAGWFILFALWAIQSIVLHTQIEVQTELSKIIMDSSSEVILKAASNSSTVKHIHDVTHRHVDGKEPWEP